MFGEQSVDRGAKLANSLTVNDAYFQDAALPAKFDVVQHDRFNVPGPERMEIKHSIDRQFDWSIVRVHGNRVVSGKPLMAIQRKA